MSSSPCTGLVIRYVLIHFHAKQPPLPPTPPTHPLRLPTVGKIVRITLITDLGPSINRRMILLRSLLHAVRVVYAVLQRFAMGFHVGANVAVGLLDAVCVVFFVDDIPATM